MRLSQQYTENKMIWWNTLKLWQFLYVFILKLTFIYQFCHFKNCNCFIVFILSNIYRCAHTVTIRFFCFGKLKKLIKQTINQCGKLIDRN
jgi:hypothetical protein